MQLTTAHCLAVVALRIHWLAKMVHLLAQKTNSRGQQKLPEINQIKKISVIGSN